MSCFQAELGEEQESEESGEEEGEEEGTESDLVRSCNHSSFLLYGLTGRRHV